MEGMPISGAAPERRKSHAAEGRAAEFDFAATAAEDANRARLLAEQADIESKIQPILDKLRQGAERRKDMSPQQVKLADLIEDQLQLDLDPLIEERKRIAEELDGKAPTIN